MRKLNITSIAAGILAVIATAIVLALSAGAMAATPPDVEYKSGERAEGAFRQVVN